MGSKSSERWEPAFIGGWRKAGAMARKALSVPLSLVLAASCSPLPSYALAPGESDDLQASPAIEQGMALSAEEEGSSSLYSLYLPVLFRAANGLGEFAESYQASDASQWAPEYSLFDIGGEGAPELMVRTNAFSGAGLVHVFSAQAGEAVEIGSYWEWFGGSAGNDAGQLFVAGWNQGSSYVNSITLEGGKVVSTFLKSGKATSTNPSGEIQMVNEFLASNRASWIESAGISDYSLLERQARYSLSKGTLTIASAGEYTGDPKRPQVTVKFNGSVLQAGVDYEVTYQNNVDAGVATVSVVGLGDYKGALSGRFNIARADVSKAEASLAEAGAYTGNAKTPAATVRLGSRVLEAGADYDISYANNVNAGSATATITGKGNYQGSKKAGFSIAKAEVSDAAVSIASAGAYTGTAKTPQVTASLGDRSLVQDVDYKVTYKNNKNAGTATVIVDGKGNYQGSKTSAFTIDQADVSKASVSLALAGNYTGTAKMPSATVKLLGVSLRVGSDYEVTYKNNVNAGKATATIVGKGNYKGTKNEGFTIGQADISSASLSVASAGSYTGSAKTPTVKVSYGGKTLTRDTDFKVSYQNNKNAGKATATVDGQGNYKGSKSATFTIAKASNPMSLKTEAKTLKVSALEKKAQTFKAISFAVKAQGKVTYKNASSASVSNKVSVNSSTGAITVKKGVKKGSFSVKVTVSAAGNANYQPLSKTATVTVRIVK